MERGERVGRRQVVGVPLDPEQLVKAGVAVCAVVKLAAQPAGVLQQVVLRPDKVRGGLIRLGETVGDEALGWIACEHVVVVEVLGRVEIAGDGRTAVQVVEAVQERVA